MHGGLSDILGIPEGLHRITESRRKKHRGVHHQVNVALLVTDPTLDAAAESRAPRSGLENLVRGKDGGTAQALHCAGTSCSDTGGQCGSVARRPGQRSG